MSRTLIKKEPSSNDNFAASNLDFLASVNECECEDKNSSLRFFYNCDDETIIATTDEATPLQKEVSLSRELFNDGNFEVVDGLIVLNDKKETGFKLGFKSNYLAKRGTSCNAKKEIQPRAA